MSASVSAGRVQVFARTRPTSNFPHDMIHLEADGKVGIVTCINSASVMLMREVECLSTVDCEHPPA